jgi:hypothetical protein
MWGFRLASVKSEVVRESLEWKGVEGAIRSEGVVVSEMA